MYTGSNISQIHEEPQSGMISGSVFSLLRTDKAYGAASMANHSAEAQWLISIIFWLGLFDRQ